MMVHVPNLLSGEQVAHIRGVLSGTPEYLGDPAPRGRERQGT